MLSPRRAFSYALLTVALNAPMHAAELVMLHNGFTITCTTHETLTATTVRLHVAGGSAGEQNYIDLPAASIAAVEHTQDELSQTAVATTSQPQQPIAALLQTSGASHNVNVALLASIVQAESAGNPRAVSRAGAGGLMQLMPGTAAQYDVTDRFAPESNLNGGSAYLSDLLTRYHENLALALAAYNAGPAAVDRYRGIPPYRETQRYVARVIREFNRRVLAEQYANR